MMDKKFYEDIDRLHRAVTPQMRFSVYMSRGIRSVELNAQAYGELSNRLSEGIGVIDKFRILILAKKLDLLEVEETAP